MEKNFVNVNIDGTEYKVEAGLNVLEACRSVGVEIPFFCYHPNLKVAGSCRMCLVVTGMPARDRATGKPVLNPDGSPVIAFSPKPTISCGTKVAEGMHVITDSALVRSCREGVLEFLLLNHPLDCPICDKAGECKLQEYAHTFGKADSRYVEAKNVKPKKVEFAGKIFIDAERCILCSRCIRFAKEVVGRDIFGFIKRGSKTEIAVYSDTDTNYLINAADICPVGAITEKAFRFKMRTWFLKVTKGISSESSAGVNTRVWSRNGVIYRITPRENPEVNGPWMSDTGRYEYVESGEKIACAQIDSSPCDSSYAADRCVEIMKLGGVAVVANGSQTLEEMFMLKKLSDACAAKVYMASHTGSDDGFLVSADRKPNTRGAFVTGLISEYPKADLSDLLGEVNSGAVKTIICFGEDLAKLGFDSAALKKANVVYVGREACETSREAKICVPVSGVFEKSGMWINRQFRLQKFEAAVSAPSGMMFESEFISLILRSLTGGSFQTPSIGEIRARMEAEIPCLAGCSKVGDGGMPIDGSKYSGEPFPEKPAFMFGKEEK